MPSFDIIKKVEPDETFRVKSIIGAFDLDLSHIDEHFKGNIDIENKDWNIGLIVGGSGTGKSTIAKECFDESYFTKYEYKAKSVIDDMSEGKTIKEIEQTFTNVGFSSPPCWLKPYHVLSNGEKMRVDLARCILDDKEIICFDEFTSVVNREVAKTTSYAISKAIRRLNKKFVAISCHDDIIDWLEPDWIYNTDTKSFFGLAVNTKDRQLNLKYTKLTQNIKTKFGNYLESIII